MKIKKLFLISLFIFSSQISHFINAQDPVWKGKGRIAISSDGNEHDHDDWAATPLSLALLSAAGLQEQMVLYTYSDHIWGSNQEYKVAESEPTPYDQMRESALKGAEWFGFDKTRFICAVDNAEVAYEALKNEINASSEENPLFIIAAGPMQVAGEAIYRSDASKLKYVTLISHSNWNNEHADRPYSNTDWDFHTGWTFNRIKTLFSTYDGGELNCIRIVDQNGGPDYNGFKAPIKMFDWIKTSPMRDSDAYKKGAWDWLYSRLETVVKNGDFDPSDAGMIVYLLTGIEKTDPLMAKDILENPKR